VTIDTPLVFSARHHFFYFSTAGLGRNGWEQEFPAITFGSLVEWVGQISVDWNFRC